MATTKSKEKRPTEIIPLVENFADILGGASIINGNVAVTAKDFATGVDATADVIVPGSVSTTTSQISCRLRNGIVGKLYLITLSTGATSIDEVHIREWLLKVTNTPVSATLLCDLAS